MAFDWIAGTALVVGIGSLALTWQSTRAAKRSIDTSIEIYEKQKRDEEERRKKIITGYKNLIAKEIYDNIQWYEQGIKLFNIIKTGKSVSVANTFGKTHIKFNHDGKEDGIIPFKFHLKYTDSLLSEISTLDTELFLEILSLKNKLIYCNEMLDCIYLLLKNNKNATNFIMQEYNSFKELGEIMNKIKSMCSI